MARLSTHVLDTMHGKPAANVALELYRLGKDNSRTLVTKASTNADGRTDAPLMSGDRLEVGQYELVFHIGDYFRAIGVALSEPAFLDIVPLRFGIADATGHYHVPLLASPFAYSTYRGS
ncbi:MAG: hydroxyisourate hydrolase [Bosea sp. (in: a-proteobacteria)]